MKRMVFAKQKKVSASTEHYSAFGQCDNCI